MGWSPKVVRGPDGAVGAAAGTRGGLAAFSAACAVRCSPVTGLAAAPATDDHQVLADRSDHSSDGGAPAGRLPVARTGWTPSAGAESCQG